MSKNIVIEESNNYEIKTSNNFTIFNSNKENVFESQNENIIYADNDVREVLPKGYLLNNINLSSIPSIIKDAIDNAILDAKTQTLADDLIQTLKQSLENLDDGVYKKTYIDNIISYVENLVVSKVSPETVAAIADSKLAVALEGFATASNVSLLLSRVENSEAEIETVKQTINTKDSARALQLEQMEARVDETFAGYSDAIDLYVDSEGNVKSQKIETLSTNIGLQLQEINELIVDTNNELNAKSIKLITSPSGAITGYSFQDGSGLKSTFEINADNFKIANAYNTYSPFSIVGTSLYFNGKVTFSNITGGESIVTKDNLQTVFNSNITTIDGGIITTNEAFINKLNATGGLIADTVTANEFVGKTFTGGVINGASINGAVIKASYLDLDGELEVLTNYHITPAMYNANPSLYTDAVYLSGTNEYRIPSVSTVKETTKNVALHSINATSSSFVKSYNTANVGHNSKCVAIRPTLNYSGEVLAITVNTPGIPFNAGSSFAYSYETSLYCLGSLVGRFKIRREASYDSGTNTVWYVNGVATTSFTVNKFGIQFTVSVFDISDIVTLSVIMTANNVRLTADFTAGDIIHATTNAMPYEIRWQQANNYVLSSSSYFSTTSLMTINNMI